jgi:hypothetical protein
MYPFELLDDPSESVVDAFIVKDIGHVASDLANLRSASNPTSQLPSGFGDLQRRQLDVNDRNG